MTNVVILVMDAARAKTVQDTGSVFPDASKYENAFSPSPWTLPSHASLFTSRYPSSHGAHAAHKRLRAGIPVLAEVFQEAGYETAAISNNTWISEEFGFGRGFEAFHKTWQYIQSDDDLGRIAREYEGTDKIRALIRATVAGNPAVNIANALYGRFIRKQVDSGARHTNQWIDSWLDTRDQSRPFFLFANYLEPHLEYRPPREYAKRYLPDTMSYRQAMDVSQDPWGYIAGTVEMGDRDFDVLQALYRAEIAYLQDRLRDLRDRLESAGELDETIVVITADHGENIGEHGLMDHQYCLYDTLLHVPLTIRGGAFSPGRIVEQIVQLTDLGPTLLDAAGLEATAYRNKAQGQSFHPDAYGSPGERVYAEYMAPQPSMDALERRVGDLPATVTTYDRSLRAIRSRAWKLIRGSDGSRELYDVSSDPRERNDRSTDCRETTERLVGELDGWVNSFEQPEYDGDVELRPETKRRLEELGYLQ